MPFVPTERRSARPAGGAGRGSPLTSREEHDLRPARVDEPGALVQRADVRPLRRDAVHAGRGHRAVRVPPRDAPAVELREARGGERVGGVDRIGPEDEPADLAGVPVRLTDALLGRVPEQLGGSVDAPVAAGDERRAIGDPRVDDELAGLALEPREHRVDGDGDPGHDGGDVGVDERRQLLPVAAPERAHLDRRHRRTSSGTGANRARDGGRYRCGTPESYRPRSKTTSTLSCSYALKR